MTPATLTISAAERDTLHELMLRRLFVLGDDPPALARAEGVNADQLAEEFADDLRLMQDLGWPLDQGEGEGGELTLPSDQLAGALRRLRRDARRAPCEERHEREPQETDEERWRRFRDAAAVCDELLARLDPWDQSREELSHARKAAEDYRAVSDGLILAAVERAVAHEREDEVLAADIYRHLGLRFSPRTNAALHPRLEDLRRAGLLTYNSERGHGAEPYWSLTAVGRERLAADREGGAVGDLPESPQHRAWRRARAEAAVRIEGFRRDLTDAIEKAGELIDQYRPVMSKEWFELSERLHWSCWRLASATYCLTEWMEPEDERPDVDENPGPHPGRRTISAWDDPPRREGS